MKEIKVIFFAGLTEITGTHETTVSGIPDSESLKAHFASKYPKLKNYPYLLAVNQDLVRENKKLKPGDEIAFLPPFAGG